MIFLPIFDFKTNENLYIVFVKRKNFDDMENKVNTETVNNVTNIANDANGPITPAYRMTIAWVEWMLDHCNQNIARLVKLNDVYANVKIDSDWKHYDRKTMDWPSDIEVLDMTLYFRRTINDNPDDYPITVDIRYVRDRGFEFNIANGGSFDACDDNDSEMVRVMTSYEIARTIREYKYLMMKHCNEVIESFSIKD